MKLAVKDIKIFQKTVFGYYKKSGRTFPWRETRDPYAILISEVMLQQTQAPRVVPFFVKWMKQFPTAGALAKAPLPDVLKIWQGLGYNRRALNLKRAGEMIVKTYGGVIPRDLQKIDALPGVGPYTAGAIGAFAFGIPSVFIETNIRTVYLHFFFKGRRKVRDEEILKVVEQTLPNKGRQSSTFFPIQGRTLFAEPCLVGEWYSALMDYGAMLKEIQGNENVRSHSYTKQSKFKGSRRELRGTILRQVVNTGVITPVGFRENHTKFNVADVCSELVTEGFLKKEGRGFKLA